MFTVISQTSSSYHEDRSIKRRSMFLPFKRSFPAMFEVYWDHRNVSDKPCDLRPSISTQSIGVRRSIKVGRKDVLLSINSNKIK